MIAANPPVETRKDSRLPKVRYWNGSQSRRTDGQWLSAQCTYLGRKFRCEFARKTNWPNERPTAARKADDCKIGKARRTD